jgi:aldose 1-epimerase
VQKITLAFTLAGLLVPWERLQASEASSSISHAPFGTTRDGQGVEIFTLKNRHGLTAKVITYGAIIYSLEAPDKQGKFVNVTLNRETVADYERKSPCFGALLGRYANRIAKGQFTLNGQLISLPRNGGPNHIHGGARGFDKHVWQAEPVQGKDFVAIKLTYISKDGEEGYPGTLQCIVRLNSMTGTSGKWNTALPPTSPRL